MSEIEGEIDSTRERERRGEREKERVREQNTILKRKKFETEINDYQSEGDWSLIESNGF